jgi:hypothetical protein
VTRRRFGKRQRHTSGRRRFPTSRGCRSDASREPRVIGQPESPSTDEEHEERPPEENLPPSPTPPWDASCQAADRRYRRRSIPRGKRTGAPRAASKAATVLAPRSRGRRSSVSAVKRRPSTSVERLSSHGDGFYRPSPLPVRPA